MHLRIPPRTTAAAFTPLVGNSTGHEVAFRGSELIQREDCIIKSAVHFAPFSIGQGGVQQAAYQCGDFSGVLCNTSRQIGEVTTEVVE